MPELRPYTVRARLILGLALAGLVASAGARGDTGATDDRERDEIVYAPTVGREVTKRFVHESERRLTSFVVRLPGQSETPQEMDLVLSSSQELEFLDRFEDVVDGRPTVLVREHVSLSRERRMRQATAAGREERDVVETSELDGRVVRFARPDVADDAGWTASVPTDGEAGAPAAGETALLDGLVAVADFTSFLPPEPVAVGDRWAVDFDGFRRDVLRPGGDLGFASDPPQPPADRQLGERAWDALEGRVTARYDGRRVENELEYYVIAFEGRLTSDARVETEGGARRLTERRDFEGELWWNPMLGLPRHMVMRVTGEVGVLDEIAVEAGGTRQEFEREMSFEQSSTYRASFE